MPDTNPAPTSSTKSEAPERRGPRNSTIILMAAFVAVFALYIFFRPEPVSTAPTPQPATPTKKATPTPRPTKSVRPTPRPPAATPTKSAETPRSDPAEQQTTTPTPTPSELPAPTESPTG